MSSLSWVLIHFFPYFVLVLTRRGDSFSILTGKYVLQYLVILVTTLELFLHYLVAHLGVVVKGKVQR